jgi:predicted nicotinamide N-methyase
VDGHREAFAAVRASLAERLAALRGTDIRSLPPALLDVAMRRHGEIFYLRPVDWEQLRHEEGAAGRPVPYWARPWPSGIALADALAAEPPAPGRRILELGCGLALPSIVAARARANVLVTDAVTDAVAFAAHSLAVNETDATVAHADWAEHGDMLAEQGPFDLVLAADVLYTRANVESALRLLPRLLAPWGEAWLADPGRAGTRDFLAAARASFHVHARRLGDEVTLYRLVPR